MLKTVYYIAIICSEYKKYNIVSRIHLFRMARLNQKSKHNFIAHPFNFSLMQVGVVINKNICRHSQL